jgi:hypothetical protein
MALEIPKVTRVEFNENRGEYREVQVEDRPCRLLTNQFNEDKGWYEDVEVPLTDMEILEAGGIKRFFNDDGSHRDGSWPYDPDVKPATRKKKKKKKAKRKPSK